MNEKIEKILNKNLHILQMVCGDDSRSVDTESINDKSKINMFSVDYRYNAPISPSKKFNMMRSKKMLNDNFRKDDNNIGNVFVQSIGNKSEDNILLTVTFDLNM